MMAGIKLDSYLYDENTSLWDLQISPFSPPPPLKTFKSLQKLFGNESKSRNRDRTNPRACNSDEMHAKIGH